MAKKTTSKQPALNFESALTELEGLVERLERGEQGLEEALTDFERGIQLTRHCQESIQNAEQRVEQLIKDNGIEQLTLFSSSEDGE